MTVHFNSVPCCAGQALDAFTSRHLVAEYDLVGVCVCQSGESFRHCKRNVVCLVNVDRRGRVLVHQLLPFTPPSPPGKWPLVRF
jgi:hypothetical protein